MASLYFSLLLLRAIIFAFLFNHSKKLASSTETQTLMEAEDPFNKLPNPLISSILSFLPVNVAARTSVLSSRWRTLWKQTTHLDFNQKFLLEPRFRNLIRSELPLDFRTRIEAYLFTLGKIGNSDDLIESILKSHYVPLHGCRILHLIESHEEKHAEWVRCLLEEKKVQELSLACEFNACWNVYDHEFPIEGTPLKPCRGLDVSFEMLSRFCVLELTNYLLITPLNFVGSQNLKTLKLTMVWVTVNMLDKIFNGCVSLENLSLIRCKQFKSLRIRSERLKFLELRELKLRLIDVCASNLKVIEFDTMICKPKMLLIDAPNLREFRCYCDPRFGGKTKLGFGRLLLTMKEIVENFKDYPASSSEGFSRGNIIQNLLALCMDFDLNNVKELTSLPFILRSCQSLRTLEINNRLITGNVRPWTYQALTPYFRAMYWHTSKEGDWVGQGLKKVYIRGFKGKRIEMKFVEYLITRSRTIEKIVISYDDDYSRERAMSSMGYLHSLEKASPNLCITLKLGMECLSKVGGSFEEWIESLYDSTNGCSYSVSKE